MVSLLEENAREGSIHSHGGSYQSQNRVSPLFFMMNALPRGAPVPVGSVNESEALRQAVPIHQK
jgi:hypothetical protein